MHHGAGTDKAAGTGRGWQRLGWTAVLLFTAKGLCSTALMVAAWWMVKSNG